jgi:hypothetical protein
LLTFQHDFVSSKHKPSNVNIPRPQRIGLNEIPACLHFVAHQHGEDAVGFDGVADLQPPLNRPVAFETVAWRVCQLMAASLVTCNTMALCSM